MQTPERRILPDERGSSLVEQLRATMGRMELALGEILESLVWTDADGRVEWCNGAFDRLTERPRIMTVGHPLVDLLPLELDGNPVRPDDHPVSVALANGSVPTRTYRTPRAGRELFLEISATRFQPAAGSAIAFLAIRDVTELQLLLDDLKRRALHDPLTGLANRTLFVDRVGMALARLKRRRETLALLFVDVNDFKEVNDTYGHAVGDQALRAVAERLQLGLRPGDTLARIAGDEFAVLLEDVVDGAAADVVTARIVSAFRSPMSVGGHSLSLSVSIGSDVAAKAGSTAESLLQNADFAMYTAKRMGKGRWRRFRRSDRDAVVDRTTLLADLRNAVRRRELTIHYQPIVYLESGQVETLEALLRWEHPTRGLLMPADFMRVAQESGQIVAIGAWVLRTACHDLANWQVERPDLAVSVNLSSRQLEDRGLVGKVQGAIRRSGIAADDLILEVTETFLVADEVTAARRLKRLKALGVRVAFDDFGTGYSSLSHLRAFPVDILKIDRAFIDAIDTPDGLAFLRSIVDLGRSVGAVLVGEGIERFDQIPALVNANVTSGQGYLLARPMPAAAITPLLLTGMRFASASGGSQAARIRRPRRGSGKVLTEPSS